MQHVWGKKKAYRLLLGKTEGNRSLELLKYGLKVHTKMDFREVVWVGVD
jgi:hypothetical protein